MSVSKILLGVALAASGTVGAADGNGLVATFFSHEDFTGASMTRVDPCVDFTWSTGSPNVAGIGPEWWSAVWTGEIDIPASDTYTFSTWSDDGVVLLIDGTPVIEDWTGHAKTLDKGSVALSAGRHHIQLRFYNSHLGAVIQLRWASSAVPDQVIPTTALFPIVPPAVVGTGSGIAATYYDEGNFAGFSTAKLDSRLDFSWDGKRPPARSISPDTWSAKWVGELEAQYTDTYTISALTNRPFSLAINGQSVIDDAADSIDRVASGKVFLKAGQRYGILATYRATASPSLLSVSWSCPLAPNRAIPTTQLYPTNERQATKLELLSPMISLTNPAWVEGAVGHWTTKVSASVNCVPVPVTAESSERWFLNNAAAGKPPGVRLTGTLNFLTASSVNGRTKTNMLRPLIWATIDMANLPYGGDTIDVRPGDSLRLTAGGKGRLLSIEASDAEGLAAFPKFSGRPGQAFAATFSAPGVYKVVAAIDGTKRGGLTVRVPSVNLLPPIACHIDYQRNKDIVLADNGATVSILPNDPLLMDVNPFLSPVDGGRRIALRPLNGGAISLQARLGSDGPILTLCDIDEFTLRSDAQKQIAVIAELTNGKQILEGDLVMSPLVPGLLVSMKMYTGGITWMDGTVAQTISSDLFRKDGDQGIFTYQMIANHNAYACHSFMAAQQGVQVSK